MHGWLQSAAAASAWCAARQARSEVEAAAVAKEGDDSERSALIVALTKARSFSDDIPRMETRLRAGGCSSEKL